MFHLHEVLRGPNSSSRARQYRSKPLRIEVLEERRLLTVAATATFLKDIRTDPSSNPANLVDVGGTLFFNADDGIHGIELWKSDGTVPGTALVADIAPGIASSIPTNLTNVNGTLFFTADDGSHGRELWKSDSSGTTIVSDIRPGLGTSSPTNLTSVGATLFFTANDGSTGTELWRHDAVGTALVKDIQSGGQSSSPANLTNVSGTLFFSADDGTHGRELWKTDNSGTVLVRDIQPGRSDALRSGFSAYLNSLTNVNGTLFFAANDGTHGARLWKSDSVSGAVMASGTGPDSPSDPVHFANVNGTLFFNGFDKAQGHELWKCDGHADPVLVRDIWPGGGIDSGPQQLTNVNGTLFFETYSGGASHFELWKSDPALGAVRIPSPDSFEIEGPLINSNGKLFLLALDASTHQGTELWKYEDRSGLSLVRDISVGRLGAFDTTIARSASNFAGMNGRLFFGADDLEHGMELWSTDGSRAGTSLVSNINDTFVRSSPTAYINSGGTTYFTVSDGTLWQTDGTTTGTVAGLSALTRAANLTDVNGKLFLTGYNGRQLIYWNSGDPSSVPSSQNRDIPAGHLTNANGILFYSSDLGNGTTLWKKDGNSPQAVLMKQFSGDASYPSTISSFTNANGRLFFKKDSDELWTSDGTPEGTIRVDDASASNPDRNMNNLTGVNGDLLFTANAPLKGLELWKSDGTPAGTFVVKDIMPLEQTMTSLTNVNGNLFFVARNPDQNLAIWKSDGSEATTVLVKELAGVNPTNLTNHNGKLYFVSDWGSYVSGLWSSDGTTNGTALVHAFPIDSTIRQLTSDNGLLFFSVGSNDGSFSLWQSDGTDSGTVPVHGGGPFIAQPTSLTNANGLLIFTADDGIHGPAPWVVATASAQLFYNESKFDGNTPGVSASDDLAVATDKRAYHSGDGTASFDNVSSYSKGINGLMVDLFGSHSNVSAADFTFQIGNDNTPGAWSTAPAPTTLLVRPGAGVDGRDRVEMIWPNNAIQNTWLEVTVAANDDTGLAAPETFFFGNAIADSGLSDATTAAVDISDELAARNNGKLLGQNIPVTNPFDYNRDGAVNIADQLLARNNQTMGALALLFIKIDPPSPIPLALGMAAPAAVNPPPNIASAFAVVAPASTASIAAGPPAWSLSRLDDLAATDQQSKERQRADYFHALALADAEDYQSALHTADDLADELDEVGMFNSH